MIRAKCEEPVFAVNFNNGSVVLHGEWQKRNERSGHVAETSAHACAGALTLSSAPSTVSASARTLSAPAALPLTSPIALSTTLSLIARRSLRTTLAQGLHFEWNFAL